MALRRIIVIGLVIATVTLWSGCTLRKNNKAENWEQYGTKSAKKVGLVLVSSEKDDARDNQAVAAMVKKASTDMGAEYQILKPGDLANDRESLVFLAENQYDLILTLGKAIEKDLNKVANEYPDVRFAIIGGESDGSNVTSIRFDKSEGAFLAGVLAASLTNTGMVGFVGVSQTGDQELQNGFARGVQYFNLVEGKQIKVTVAYAGVTAQAADDTGRGYDLGNSLYWTGSDIVFCAPGKMANGVAKSAVDNRRTAITSDRQLMSDMPWNVYGAVLDKHENAVYDLVREVIGGKFSGGKTGYGVAEGAVDIAISEAVPEEIRMKLFAVKEKLKNGQIKPYTIRIPKDLVTEVNRMPADWNRQPSNQQGQ